jgi:hypothetical protein
MTTHQSLLRELQRCETASLLYAAIECLAQAEVCLEASDAALQRQLAAAGAWLEARLAAWRAPGAPPALLPPPQPQQQQQHASSPQPPQHPARDAQLELLEAQLRELRAQLDSRPAEHPHQQPQPQPYAYAQQRQRSPLAASPKAAPAAATQRQASPRAAPQVPLPAARHAPPPQQQRRPGSPAAAAATTPPPAAPAPAARPNMLAVLTGVKEVRLKPAAAAVGAAAGAPATPSLSALLGRRFAAVHSVRKLASPSSPDSLTGEDSDFAASPAPAAGARAPSHLAPRAPAPPAPAPAPAPLPPPRAFLGELTNGALRLRATPGPKQPAAAAPVEAGGRPSRTAKAQQQPLSLAAAVAASAARRGLPAAEI